MADDITEAELQKLLSEGLSQNEIARRTGIPRSTLRRRLKTLAASLADLDVPEHGIPYVHEGTQQTTQPTETTDDLQEMLAWWRERKRVLQNQEDTEQETQRQTYHVQKRYIEAIKHAADLEGVSIMEIVNRAFKQFFADRA
jgi:response regulator of citrate/malate metabolism